MKQYFCPGCNSIWTEFDLELSEGSCLTDPDECGWEDELELLINQGWYREVIRNFTNLSKAQVTVETAWDAINFAKAALSMIGDEG